PRWELPQSVQPVAIAHGGWHLCAMTTPRRQWYAPIPWFLVVSWPRRRRGRDQHPGSRLGVLIDHRSAHANFLRPPWASVVRLHDRRLPARCTRCLMPECLRRRSVGVTDGYTSWSWCPYRYGWCRWHPRHCSYPGWL